MELLSSHVPEQQGISSVHDLNDHVTTLHDTPKLPPKSKTLLERGDRDMVHGFFLAVHVSATALEVTADQNVHSYITTPFKETMVFLSMELFSSHTLLPLWATRNL